MPQEKTKRQQQIDAAKRRAAAQGTKVLKGSKAKAGSPTAADREKFAPGRGGLGAMARKEKARRAPHDAHVQEYYRWKNRKR